MYTCFTRYLSFALGPILGTNSFSKTSSRTISARARPSIQFSVKKYQSINQKRLSPSKKKIDKFPVTWLKNFGLVHWDFFFLFVF